MLLCSGDKLTAVFLGFYCVAARGMYYASFTAQRIKANLQLRVMELAGALCIQFETHVLADFKFAKCIPLPHSAFAELEIKL